VPTGLEIEAHINLISQIRAEYSKYLYRCLIPSTIYARGLLWINFWKHRASCRSRYRV